MSSGSSFRDPAGFCLAFKQKMLRVVSAESLADFEAFLGTQAAGRFLERRELVTTRKLGGPELERCRAQPELQGRLSPEQLGAIFEHEKISFPSFPREWPPEMLLAAGELTLRLAEETLAEGYGLKDATPHNVLFRGSKPVFIDLLSFERRDPGDPLWKPYAQFVRTFILPLLVNRRWGIRLADIFMTHRDGLTPQEVYRMCGRWQRLAPPWLNLVSLPAWLASRSGNGALYQPRKLADAERAQFIVQSLFRRLGRTLRKVQPVKARSHWSDYMESHSYSKENFSAKEEFVRRFLDEARPKRVLDIGANTGHFSILAAQSGASVVAIDSDPACVGGVWSEASAKRLDILPLVIDLARPSPALGWRNRESPAFLDRATGAFDAVLMLAVLHHLMVSERIPLHEIVELAAGLTSRWLVIEFVGLGDAMFQRIARGRESLFNGFDQTAFEQALRQQFEFCRKLDLPGTHRALYLLRKREAASTAA